MKKIIIIAIILSLVFSQSVSYATDPTFYNLNNIVFYDGTDCGPSGSKGGPINADWLKNFNYDQSPLGKMSKVMRWREKVERELEKQGVSKEYTPILLGIIKNESNGDSERYPDIMQSSESQGLAPNTISNVDESIRAGVAHFKNGLEKIEKSQTGIWSLIQGYNFGHGFIDWLEKNNKPYSVEAAEEFSKGPGAENMRKAGYSVYREKHSNRVTELIGKPYYYRNSGVFTYAIEFAETLGFSDDQLKNIAEGRENGGSNSNSGGSSNNNCIQQFLGGLKTITEAAFRLAWPNSQERQDAKPEYDEALEKTGVRRDFSDSFAKRGMSCDAFVSTVMRLTVDKNFQCCGVTHQYAYLRKNSDKYKEIPNIGNDSNLESGDILLVDGGGGDGAHIWFYLKDENGSPKTGHASYSQWVGKIDNGPRLTDYRGPVKIYRYIGA